MTPSSRAALAPEARRSSQRIGAARRAALAALLLVLGGCPAAPERAPPKEPGTSPDVETPKPAPKLVVVPAGAKSPGTPAVVAFAEVAATKAQRERGLMGRDRLDPDHGMLFAYRKAETRKFWMMGCTTGLDIAFLRPDGTIANVATLPPGAGLPPDQVPEAWSTAPALWVLEMEPGWFARKGLAAGDAVDVSAAVAGVEPE